MVLFDKTQCVNLVEEALGGRVEGLSADLMWKASGGNALFVRHLVEGALEAGSLQKVRGVWQLRGGTAITSELASLLDTRIEQLPEDEAHTLQLLAFAEPLTLDTLSTLVGAETVERVERRGLIRVIENRATLDVRFTHPLYGEVIRRGLGRAAARRLTPGCSCLGQRRFRSRATHTTAELALDSEAAPRPNCSRPRRRMPSR